MTDPAPPAFVTKRDGRMAPFEADRISRALFAATEEQGRPDAFLARELADGVVHFLATDYEGQIPTTQQIAEVVVRVVRELGHPALALAFATHREDGKTSLTRARREQSLSAIYTRDLTAAQQAGLITLTDLDAPDELAGRVAERLTDPIDRRAQLLAVDGLDYLAVLTDRTPDELMQSLDLNHTVINLNGAEAPPWASSLAEGPLFLAQPRAIDRDRVITVADELLDLLIPQYRIDWHLGELDFAPDRLPRLLRVLAYTRQSSLCFVFDRPRRSIALAEGLDRRHPAALVAVELHLPALAKQGGLLADVERFCQRLGSLARLALSAAGQKRDHLRKHSPDLVRGFVLDRARLVVVPVGLDAVVRLYSGWGLANGGASLDLGRRIVARLLDVLRLDGRILQLDVCLDGPACFVQSHSEQIPGLTPWDDRASLESQLRAAGAIHAQTEQGTLALRIPTDEPADDETLAALLHQAWRKTEVVRLRLVHDVTGRERARHA